MNKKQLLNRIKLTIAIFLSIISVVAMLSSDKEDGAGLIVLFAVMLVTSVMIIFTKFKWLPLLYASSIFVQAAVELFVEKDFFPGVLCAIFALMVAGAVYAINSGIVQFTSVENKEQGIMLAENGKKLENPANKHQIFFLSDVKKIKIRRRLKNCQKRMRKIRNAKSS